MDDLFSNILYLIPIAFFIAIRLINARGKQSGNEQQKDDSGGLGELIKKINEAQESPAYGRAWTEDRGVYLPPRPQLEQKKTAAKKAAKKAPPVPEKSHFKSIAPDAASAASDSASAKTEAKASGLRGMKPGWTPLQQAVVWAEILGTPKGA